MIADCVDHHGKDLPHAPRSILKRQIARAQTARLRLDDGFGAGAYVFDEKLRLGAASKGYRGMKCRLVHRGLPHPADDQGGAADPRHPQHMDAAGVPVEFSKGEWGPGQEEINLQYAEALEMADRHSPSTRTAPRRSPIFRARPSPSWRSGTTAWRAAASTCIPRCGTPRSTRRCSMTRRPPRTACPRCSATILRASSRAREMSLFLRALS